MFNNYAQISSINISCRNEIEILELLETIDTLHSRALSLNLAFKFS